MDHNQIVGAGSQLSKVQLPAEIMLPLIKNLLHDKLSLQIEDAHLELAAPGIIEFQPCMRRNRIGI